jgi:nicotinate-nucleotide pyrophosphorylase (carboxylating)
LSAKINKKINKKINEKKYCFDLKQFIALAIKEDAPWGDISSQALIPSKAMGEGRIISKGSYIVSGLSIIKAVYLAVDKKIKFKSLFKDGSSVKKGQTIIELKGNLRALLLAERLALNILSHMMGIATSANRLSKLIKGTKAKVLDTRKTTPGLRVLEKMAVKDGGGRNHRFCLSDAVLAKENHIAVAGGVEKTLKKLSKLYQNSKQRPKIELEIRTLEEFKKILASPFKPDIVMLDNMDIKNIKKAVALNKGRVKLEVSGGVNESNISKYAKTGVDFISVGALTHSVSSADLSFLLNEAN